MNLPRMDPDVRVLQASSRAPDGSNLTDFAHSIRTDAEGRYVLMEASGPGAITRIWFTPFSANANGNPAAIGQIQIFFDGEETPRVDLPASDFFSGKTAPFLAPICGNYMVSSGGNYCNLRMPFRKGVKFTASKLLNYYDIGYETYAQGAAVQSFEPSSPDTQTAARDLAGVYARAGAEPDFLPAGARAGGTARIAAGDQQVIADIARPGTLDAVEITLDPHDDAALRGVWLEARWDGESKPSVAAPLADLFSSGAGERSPASGLFAGYSPGTHTGYLYFPMPFARSAQIKLVNRGTSDVSAIWNTRESAYRYDDIGVSTGRFHASYAEDAATALGHDYVLLDADGAGKVVGISFTEQGPITASSALFMEGDERVYFDGSRTPAVYGSGTEDIFSGAYYYATGAFALPDHGATAKEDVAITPGNLLKLGLTSQYRLMIADPWPFRSGIRLGIEHGAGDGMTTSAHSVVYWYAADAPAMRQTDEIMIGDSRSEQAAGYSADDSGGLRALTAFFEGDTDGNISSLAQDLANAGSLPPLPGTDLLGESETAQGRTHPAGAAIRFSLNLDDSNRGAILRRQLDQGIFGQRSEVWVDGELVGVWFTPGSNGFKRWAESDFSIPARLTASKTRISVELRVQEPEQAPAGADIAWTDFRYLAFSVGSP